MPESTIRYYRDQFEEFIPVSGEGRNRRYPDEALPVLEFIAYAMRSNMPRDSIRDSLYHRFSVALEPQQQSATTQQQTTTMLADYIAESLRNELSVIHEELDTMRHENQALREYITEHLDQQEQRIIERDKALLETLHQMQENRKEIAATQKRSFLSRLFGK